MARESAQLRATTVAPVGYKFNGTDLPAALISGEQPTNDKIRTSWILNELVNSHHNDVQSRTWISMTSTMALKALQAEIEQELSQRGKN